MDTIGRVIFGVRTRSNDKPSELAHYCHKALNFTFTDFKLICDAMFPNLMALAEECMQRTIFDNDCNEFFKRFAENLRNNAKKTDSTNFLNILLNGTESVLERKKNYKTPMTSLEIAGQCFLFLIAGYETTASAISFALYNLANFIEIQNKAYESIKDILVKDDVIDYQNISSMKYLEQIMMETLRLFPPVPRFDRECSSDLKIGDIYLKKGCIVSVPIFALHYDNDLYPEPHKFDPERFTDEACNKRDPFSFLSFGFGPRNCIGKQFARLEFQLIVARMLYKYRFDILEQTPAYPPELNTAGMTRTVSPIILKVSKR